MTVRSQTDIRRVKMAIRRLESLIDENDSMCTVRASVKNAVRPYVDDWVLPDLRELLPAKERGRKY